MEIISHQSLLKIAACIFFIFNAQLTCAAMNDEDIVNKIFETHGKQNVVDFISQKREGKITIQKDKSFLNIRGRPDIKLITAKSVIQDLKILKIDASTLEIELDIYIENESKKQQEENDKINKSASLNDDKEPLLSSKLKYQIETTQSKYNESTNTSERRRLSKELSILRRAYKQAKDNEKSKLRVYFPDKKTKTTRSPGQCKSIRSKLADLTEASYRHQIFFCNDRSYRIKNPKSCGGNKYGPKYTLQQYKDEVSRLRMEASKYCGS